MDSLLTVAEPDGFPVGMRCVIWTHAGSNHIPTLVRIDSHAYRAPAHCESQDDRAVSTYGQKVTILPGQDHDYLTHGKTGFYDLSWMRPATPEEISTLTNAGNNDE